MFILGTSACLASRNHGDGIELGDPHLMIPSGTKRFTQAVSGKGLGLRLLWVADDEVLCWFDSEHNSGVLSKFVPSLQGAAQCYLIQHIYRRRMGDQEDHVVEKICLEELARRKKKLNVKVEWATGEWRLTIGGFSGCFAQKSVAEGRTPSTTHEITLNSWQPWYGPGDGQMCR